MIDELPAHQPKFHYEEVTVAGEVYPFFYRNIIECIKSLYSDPDLADVMLFAPERHFKDAEGRERVYHEMNTGKWWWKMQVCEIPNRYLAVYSTVLGNIRSSEARSNLDTRHFIV